MADRLPDLVEVVRLPSGHCPAVTDPASFAAVLSRVAGS
jgi:pimeloyl-ACP methyl ester carboxylesterase